MSQNFRSPRPDATFNAVNSHISARGDINLVNVAINKESSILTRLKASLNPVPIASYDSYEAKQRTECFPNTRVQVLNDIEAWITAKGSNAPIYILDGVAGIGKSTIAQTIAARAANLGLLGASFFFSRDEDLRKIAKHFFPTIAYQVGNPDAPTKRLYQQLSLLVLEPLRELLSQRTEAILVVLDALDECEEEGAEELLTLLGEHIHGMSGLKFLVTTRPEWHIRRILDEDKNHERFRLHEIEDSIVQSDIRLYLQHRLSAEEIRKLVPARQQQWQPSAKEMESLCGICGTLFIIATTATKFILDAKRLNPQRQLSRLLDGVSTSNFAGSKINILDETYIRILWAAQPQSDLGGIDSDWFRDLNKVLGALITLANPLPCKAFSLLLDMDPDDVEIQLEQLHSLIAPSGSGADTTFRMHHKSFPDFITNKERIQRALERQKLTMQPDLDEILWIDVNDHHLQLAKACFMVMNRDLRWNMADIEEADWYKDKKDISKVVLDLISPELAYAVLHWASHILSSRKIDIDTELQEQFHAWTSSNILHWVEVMVILNRVNAMYDILQNALTSIKYIMTRAWPQKEKVEELLSDTLRFVQRESEVMTLSPIQVYRSCIPFIPTDTALYRTYGTTAMLKVRMERSTHWDPLLVTCVGHSGSVLSVVFSDDGAHLASGSSDKTIRLWDANTGAHIQTMASHLDKVLSVAFSNDGSKLLSGSTDKTIRLWDVKTGRQILTLPGYLRRRQSIAFSSDGSTLAFGSDDNTIRSWDATADIIFSALKGQSPGDISAVAFSKDGSRLASGSNYNTVRIWDAKTGAHILKMAINSSEPCLTRVHCSVAFSSDGTRLASGSSDNIAWILDAITGTQIHALIGHSGWVNAVAFSNDGARLASGSSDRSIRLWDTTTGVHISTLSGHLGPVNSIAFSNNGSRLASGCEANVQLWDISTSTHLSQSPNSTPARHPSSVALVTFSEDGSRLATGSYGRTARLWDAPTGTHILVLMGHSGGVRSAAFARDSSRLATGSDDTTIRLWNAKTGCYISTFSGHTGKVRSIVFAEDGLRLSSASEDETIRIWDVMTGVHLSTFASGRSFSFTSLIFSNNGLRVIFGYPREAVTARVWDVMTGANILTLTGRASFVQSVAFSSNDSQLASLSYDNSIRLWNAQTGVLESTIAGSAFSFAGPLSFVFLTSDDGVGSKNPTSLLLLVMRKNPLVTGLVRASLRFGNKWEISPLCWFPHGMEAESLAFNELHSQAAIGCKNGRVMVIDLSLEKDRLL